jgi:hypothetical protein
VQQQQQQQKKKKKRGGGGVHELLNLLLLSSSCVTWSSLLQTLKTHKLHALKTQLVACTSGTGFGNSCNHGCNVIN